MPTYAQEWTAVWTPYSQYGRGQGASPGVDIVVDEVEKNKLGPHLDALNGFYDEVEDYRKICVDLRKSPVNEALALKEQELRANVVSKSKSLPGLLQPAIEVCAKVIQDIKTAKTVIQNDRQHLTLIETVIRKVVEISNNLTADEKKYGSGIGITLDNIRRTAT